MGLNNRVIFVGGGLANGLAAFRLQATRPDVDWMLVERGPSLGGDHTWSCHGFDLSLDAKKWLQPLVAKEWPRHEVRFPHGTRTFETPYLSIRSPLFHHHLMKALGPRVRLSTDVAAVHHDRVVLTTGEVVHGALVVDGRGLDPRNPPQGVGFQKFRGLFVATAKPHGLKHPIIMDATVPQLGGYRFLYALPWSDTELLIEDTYYDESLDLPGSDKDPAIVSYLEKLGIQDLTVTGVENGILPIPLHGASLPQGTPAIVKSGLAAGLFHPTTGYSLPDAVRFADWLCAQPDLSSATLAPMAQARAHQHWRRGSFYRRLNNMLFRATPPEQRYKILAKFYEHDSRLISRFYAGRLTVFDPIRILRRKPDIQLTKALRAFFTRVAHDS